MSETQRRSFEPGAAEGKAQAEANALLRVLAKRGVEVRDELRERMLSCTDTAQLDRWLDAAIPATSIDEVL